MKTIPKRICDNPACRREYQPEGTNQRFCSPACRDAVYAPVAAEHKRESRMFANPVRSILSLAEFRKIQSRIKAPGFVVVLDASPDDIAWPPGKFFDLSATDEMLYRQSLAAGTLLREVQSGQLFTVHYREQMPMAQVLGGA